METADSIRDGKRPSSYEDHNSSPPSDAEFENAFMASTGKEFKGSEFEQENPSATSCRIGGSRTLQPSSPTVLDP